MVDIKMSLTQHSFKILYPLRSACASRRLITAFASRFMGSQIFISLDGGERTRGNGLLTLPMLNTTCPVLANSVDPDQLASEEAN